ncbi:hypothetical protein QQ045_019304 [Rhodiola kirilowii]
MTDFHLPDDVIYMILLLLPVKTLLRFRSVSKEWNNIIIFRNRSFAKEHMLMHSGNKTSSNNVLLMCTSAGYSYCCGIESNFDPEIGRRVTNVKVDLPFKKYIDETSNYWCGLSSSCHGLLCLIYHCNDRAILFIWNPLTNYYKEVPWPEEHVTRVDAERAFVGFGYDHIIDDYKIVASVYISKLQLIQVHVMTLSMNVWRSIDKTRWQDLSKGTKRIDSKPVFTMGDILWFGVDTRDSCQVMLRFDLVKEKLGVMRMPPPRKAPDNNDTTCYVYGGAFSGKLSQYKESFCFYVYQRGSIPKENYGKLNILTFKIAGAECRDEVRNEHHVPAPTVGTTLAEPVGFVSGGDMLLMSVDNGRGLAAYFLNKNGLLELNLSEQVEQSVQDVLYLEMESLISPC